MVNIDDWIDSHRGLLISILCVLGIMGLCVIESSHNRAEWTAHAQQSQPQKSTDRYTFSNVVQWPDDYATMFLAKDGTIMFAEKNDIKHAIALNAKCDPLEEDGVWHHCKANPIPKCEAKP